MDDTNSLIEQRKAKLASLRSKGIDPFQSKFSPSESCAAARANYAEGRAVAIAGRITAHRDMGKSMFIDVKDQSGRIQAYAQKNVLGDEQFHIFQHLDLGDFIGVKGTLFTTRTGEISVKAESFTIIAKALRPPPAKWHGLEDTEIRYRQRYLDLMASKAAVLAPDIGMQTGSEGGSPMDIFLKRSAIIREIRCFFHERGYVEVETPVLQAIPGGAAAQPFITQHNALGCPFYLRIALELYHKRLLVGGIDKLFEIGKNFRNEGLSRKHNPEFTMLEAYCAFGDYATMMDTVEALVKHVALTVVGTLRIPRSQRFAVAAQIDRAIEVLRDIVRQVSEERNDQGLAGEDIRTFREKMDEVAIQPLQSIRDDCAHKAAHVSAAAALKCLIFGFNLVGLTEPVFPPEGGLLNEAHLMQILQSLAKRRIETLHPKAVCNTLLKLSTPGVIDLSKWEKRKYRDLVRDKVAELTGNAVPDWFAVSAAERRQIAIEMLHLGGDIAEGYEDFEVTGSVFEKCVEPNLLDPTFVTHLPKELVPLAKLSPDDPTTVEVFECCINGQEISPGYSEQNDPVAQRATLEHQAGGEQQKLDEDFLTALEHGMPPAGGIGIGIDRLCMMLLGQESIRDVILFPQLKPK